MNKNDFTNSADGRAKIVLNKDGSTLSTTNYTRNSIVAGSFAGMLSCFMFHPFDVLRTKIQARAYAKSLNKALPSLSRSAAMSSVATTSPIAIFSETMRNGGMRALYTGLSLPLTAQACYKATVFTCNRLANEALLDYHNLQRQKNNNLMPYSLNNVDIFLCGAFSGAINAFIFVSPVEYIRNQLIAQHSKRVSDKKNALKRGAKQYSSSILNRSAYMKTPMDVLTQTLRSEGITGLWRGVGVTMVRDSVGCGAFFVFHSLGQNHLPSLTGQADRNHLINGLGSGCLAGFGYWIVSLPLDSIKTLVQTGKTDSASRTIRTLIKNEGGIMGCMKRLYSGLPLALGRGCPSGAVSLVTYAAFFDWCNKNL